MKTRSAFLALLVAVTPLYTAAADVLERQTSSATKLENPELLLAAGPIDNIDLASQEVSVLGQTFKLSSFNAFSKVTLLSKGEFAILFGQYDDSGLNSATRILPLGGTYVPGASTVALVADKKSAANSAGFLSVGDSQIDTNNLNFAHPSNALGSGQGLVVVVGIQPNPHGVILASHVVDINNAHDFIAQRQIGIVSDIIRGIDGTAAPRGIDGTAIRGIDGTAIRGIDGTAIRGIDGTAIRGIDGTAIRGIDGTAIRGIDGTAIRGIDGTAIRGIDGTAIRGIDGTAIRGIDGTAAPRGIDGTAIPQGIDGTAGI